MKNSLADLLHQLQNDWGSDIIHLAGQSSAEIPSLKTGYPALDTMLSTKSIPRGRLTEFVGNPTSGALSVALSTAVHLQQEAEAVIYLDASHTLDAVYAQQCGIDLGHFYVLTPDTTPSALDMAYDLVSSGGVGLLIWDAWRLSTVQTSAAHLWSWLQRITHRLHYSSMAMIALTPSRKNTFGWIDTAFIRLYFEHQGWCYRGQDVIGWQVQVHVRKDRFNPRPQSTSFTIMIPSLEERAIP